MPCGKIASVAITPAAYLARGNRQKVVLAAKALAESLVDDCGEDQPTYEATVTLIGAVALIRLKPIDAHPAGRPMAKIVRLYRSTRFFYVGDSPIAIWRLAGWLYA